MEALQADHDQQRRSAEPRELRVSIPKIVSSLSLEDRRRRFRDERIAAERRQTEIRWAAAGVPERHGKQAWKFRGPRRWAAARDQVIRRLGTGFLIALIGKRGPGKTQIAADTCRAAIEMNLTARYAKAIDLLGQLRRGHNDCDESVAQRYLKYSLLVIDAIEVRAETGFEDQMLTHLLDKRYDGMVDTLLVCNFQRPDFEDAVGASIASRIHETGDVIECDWESFR